MVSSLPLRATTSPWRRWFESHEAQFWALQFVGWSGWAVAGAIGWIYWMPDSPYVQVYGSGAVMGVVVSTALRYLYRGIWTWPMAPRVVVALSASYLAGGVWRLGKNLVLGLYYPARGPHDMGWLGYFEGITSSFYILVTWSGLYFGIKWYQMLQAESAKVLRISATAHQAQLKALRYQLNPHFLFNTLNAISTLILERDTTRANTMVTNLSKFLRHSLDSDPMQKVSLEQELGALNLYLDIEKVRFEDRLHVDTDVSAAARKALIPSLLLQPLLENSIKYAIAASESGGVIRVHGRVVDDLLEIEVADDGPGMPTLPPGSLPQGRGVGIANTRDRLEEIYGTRHRLMVENNAPSGLVVRIRVPYEVCS